MCKQAKIEKLLKIMCIFFLVLLLPGCITTYNISINNNDGKVYKAKIITMQTVEDIFVSLDVDKDQKINFYFAKTKSKNDNPVMEEAVKTIEKGFESYLKTFKVGN